MSSRPSNPKEKGNSKSERRRERERRQGKNVSQTPSTHSRPAPWWRPYVLLVSGLVTLLCLGIEALRQIPPDSTHFPQFLHEFRDTLFQPTTTSHLSDENITFSQKVEGYNVGNIKVPSKTFIHPHLTITTLPNRTGSSPGFGVIAKTTIPAGELLMTEEPLFLFDPSVDRPSTFKSQKKHPDDPERGMTMFEVAELVWEMVEGLKKTGEIEFFDGLSDAFEGEGKFHQLGNSVGERRMGIVQTNGLTIPPFSVGIFPTIARINHACSGAVNAVYHFRSNIAAPSSRGTMHLRSVLPIEKDEEVRISYLGAHVNRETRQEHLRKNYNFECKCDVCSLSDEAPSSSFFPGDREHATELSDYEKAKKTMSPLALSDYRITQISRLKTALSGWAKGWIGGKEAISVVEEGIKLMKEEGMGYELAQWYSDGAQVATAHSDLQAAIHYHTLAYRHFSIELGSDSSQAKMSETLAKSPSKTSVWGTREREDVGV